MGWRCLHRLLRRADRVTRRDQRHLAQGRRAAVRGPSHPASLRYASKKDWTPLTQSLRPIYTAVDAAAAAAELEVFAERWNTRYPAIVRLWRTQWADFVPFLAYFPPR